MLGQESSRETSSLHRALILVRRRAVSAIPVLLIVVVATFLLLEAAPGDAVDAYLLSAGGGDAALAAGLRAQYGLDQSLLSRLWLYIAALGRLDLGRSERGKAQHDAFTSVRRRQSEGGCLKGTSQSSRP